MYKKLGKKIKNLKSDEIQIHNLFHEFENSVNAFPVIDFKKLDKHSISDIICKSVESIIEDIAAYIINKESSFLSSKNTKEMAISIQKFFVDSNLGTFEYVQKTGKNIFRVEHILGTNGTEFFKKFFTRIFDIYLKNYSFHILSNERHVCVIFR